VIRYSLIIFVLLLIVWFGWKFIKQYSQDWLPVRFVRIEGAFQFIAKDKIKQALQSHVNTGLLNIDIQQIQHAVEDLPWAKEVSVKRVWPDTIVIEIVEQTVVARWGHDSLLNTKGEVFTPDNIDNFTDLLVLSGNPGDEKRMLTLATGLITRLADQGMSLAEFKITDRQAWLIKLVGGMQIVLGTKQPLHQFQRFIETLTLIGRQQVDKIAVADLRYPNGYALQWKPDVEKINWKEVAQMRKMRIENGKKNRS